MSVQLWCSSASLLLPVFHTYKANQHKCTQLIIVMLFFYWIKISNFSKSFHLQPFKFLHQHFLKQRFGYVWRLKQGREVSWTIKQVCGVMVFLEWPTWEDFCSNKVYNHKLLYMYLYKKGIKLTTIRLNIHVWCFHSSSTIKTTWYSDLSAIKTTWYSDLSAI